MIDVSWSALIGTAGAACSALSFLPQVLKVRRQGGHRRQLLSLMHTSTPLRPEPGECAPKKTQAEGKALHASRVLMAGSATARPTEPPATPASPPAPTPTPNPNPPPTASVKWM